MTEVLAMVLIVSQHTNVSNQHGLYLKLTQCYISIKKKMGASLVAQWLRVCLLMQGTRVRALVWEDPTCRGATGPVSHNY